MKALIALPPFTQSLEELAARAKGKEQEALATTTKMVWDQVVSGKSSIGLTWPVAENAPEDAAATETVRFAILPGSREYFVHAENRMQEEGEIRQFPVLGGAGRLVSAIRGKQGLRDGANLLVLLAGKARAETLGWATKDAFPYRQSQLSKAGKWLGKVRSEEPVRQFSETVVDSLTAKDYLMDINLPSEEKYRAALDKAIEVAILGQMSAVESLSQAAAEWDAITKGLGVEKQKLAYRRSLGLEE